MVKVAPVSKKKDFTTPQGYGKTIQKLKMQLPKSPSNRVEAVMGLINKLV